MGSISVQSASATSASSSYFAPLAVLATAVPIAVGSANTTRCCLQALHDWEINDPSVVVQSSRNPSVTFTSPDQLAQSGEQFPCGATYQDNPAGASVVYITYDYCNQNCGGWELSTNAVLTQWIQPLGGFILPAVVFCLSVPRKMVFRIADGLFSNVSGELAEIWRQFSDFRRDSIREWLMDVVDLSLGLILVTAKFVMRLLSATFLGLANVIAWVMVVFATAGPMILSGLYEATVDRQVLRAIEKEVRTYKKSYMPGDNRPRDRNDPEAIRYQVHLLFAMLVGNLHLTVAPRQEQRNGNRDRENAPDDPSHQNNNIQINQPNAPAWLDVDDLIKGTLSHGPPETTGQQETTTEQETAGERTQETIEDRFMIQRKNTKIRLMSMLACQANFGATIAAPVAFFLGAFLFNIYGNLAVLGDNDNSHALAFGEWWMTVPHVAIVAGCLLAGNNPNTLEAIYSEVKNEAASPSTPNEARTTTWQFVKRAWSPFYDSDYQPVWMWERGRNKRNWIIAVQKRHGKVSSRRPSFYGSFIPVPTKDLPQMGAVSWLSMIFTVTTLITVPCMLAYTTSFYTPAIGLSCRSFTFVMYFICQGCVTNMWLIDFLYGPEANRGWTKFVPTRFTVLAANYKAVRRLNIVTRTLFVVVTWLLLAGSGILSIIGTMLQLMGVYRNCQCYVPIWAWGSPAFSFVVSTNYALQISSAQTYWTRTGAASMTLLAVFCYFGWWYQRYWRARFKKVVEEVLLVKALPPRQDFTRWGRWGEARATRVRTIGVQPANVNADAPVEEMSVIVR